MKVLIWSHLVEELKAFTTKTVFPKDKSQGLLQERKWSQAVLRK